MAHQFPNNGTMNDTPWKPTGHYLLVRVDKIPKTLGRGVIQMSEDDYRKEQLAHQIGVAVEIGPEAWRDCEAPWALPGQRVRFSRYEGQWFKLNEHDPDGDHYRLLPDGAILAVGETSYVN